MSGDISTDADHQPDWKCIVDRCCLTINAICEDYSFTRDTFVKWLDGRQKPRNQNREKIVEVITKLRDMPRIERQPAFGYATKKQIKKINSLGIGPERNKIIAAVEFQTKLDGKIR